MRAVIVDLDRSLPVSRARPADRLAIVALSAAILVFALAVALAYWMTSPTRSTDELIAIADGLR